MLETKHLANATFDVVVAKATVYYEICNLDVMENTSSEGFLQYFNQFKLQNQIRNILTIEAPISKGLLCKRLLNGWNISRMGTRVAVHLDSTYFTYRVASLELQKREADHTCRQKK